MKSTVCQQHATPVLDSKPSQIAAKTNRPHPPASCQFAAVGNSNLIHIAHHDIGIDAARRQGAGRLSRPGRPDAPEQRPVQFALMPAGFEILGYQATRMRVRGQVAKLAALALHPQVHHAPPFLAKVFHQELCQFLPAQRIVEQHRQNSPVALALQGIGRRRIEQRPSLCVAQRRRLAFAADTLKGFHWNFGEFQFRLTDWSRGWVINEEAQIGELHVHAYAKSCEGPDGPWTIVRNIKLPEFTISVISAPFTLQNGIAKKVLDWASSTGGSMKCNSTFENDAAMVPVEGGYLLAMRLVKV